MQDVAHQLHHAASHSFGGEHLEVSADERIRFTDVFDDPDLPGEMRVTEAMMEVSVDTERHTEPRGRPSGIPLEACDLGRQQALVHLARLIEPEIAN